MPGRIITIILGIAVVGGLYATYEHFKSREQAPSKTMAVHAAPAVTVSEVQTADVPNDVAAVGTAVAYHTVAVRPRVDGQILKVHFVSGAAVEQGQPLFTLDSSQLEAQLRQAEAVFERDKTQAEIATVQQQRYTPLQKDGFVSQERFESVRGKALSTADTLKADQAQIDGLRIQIGYMQIRSPIAGRTGIVNLTPGVLVHATDQQPMVVVNQVKPIRIELVLPQRYFNVLRAAVERKEAITICRSAEGGIEGEQGIIEAVDNVVDSTSGVFRASARFENASESIWPGMVLNCKAQLGIDRGALVVPSAAVQAGPKGDFVYLVDRESIARVTPVRVGRTAADRTTLVAGVASGETIVVEGQARLTDGARVAGHR